MENKVRMGVVSDTHIPRRKKELPVELMEAFKGVNRIVHAGDINKDYVLYELEELAPVTAVAGNTDDDYIRGMLGTKKVIEVGNYKIGVIHGDGERGTTFDRARKAFEGEGVSCVIFGHSHIPMNRSIENVLYFNPGSPTDKRSQERYSCGIITVDKEGIRGEIIDWL